MKQVNRLIGGLSLGLASISADAFVDIQNPEPLMIDTQAIITYCSQSGINSPILAYDTHAKLCDIVPISIKPDENHSMNRDLLIILGLGCLTGSGILYHMGRRRSHQVENYIDIGIHPKMRNHDKDSPVVLKHDTNSIGISVIEARSEVNAYQEEGDDLTGDNLGSELIQDYFRGALTQPGKLLLITYLTHKTLDIDITSEEILGYIILLIELDEVSRNDWKQKIIEQGESMGYTVDDTELADILLKIHDSCEEVERINILSELYSLIRSSKPKSLSLDHISPDVERVLNKSNIADEVRDKILDLLNKYHVGDMRREEQKGGVITLSRIMLGDISISLRIGKDGKIVQTLSGGGSDTFFTTLENLERFIQNNSDPNIV